MSRVRAFARFWWGLVVGDDWRLAAGIGVALALTGFLTSAGLTAWWLLPFAVAVLLGRSLQRAVRASGSRAVPARPMERVTATACHSFSFERAGRHGGDERY